MTEGWKCPVCGAGVAPSEKRCDHGGTLAGGIVTYPPYKPNAGTLGQWACACLPGQICRSASCPKFQRPVEIWSATGEVN